jgi:cell division protein FtsB
MTPEEQEAFLDGVRRRRLASVEAHKAATALKQKAQDERTAAKIDKESAMMEKELAALDKALDKVEKRAATLAALRLIVENRQ